MVPPARQKEWRHVQSRRWFDGNGSSLAADGRARRAGARRSASSVGNPALSEVRTEKVRREYRKYRKPLAGIRRARFINDIRRFGVSAGGRFAPDGLAEMGGNWRKLLECTTSPPNRGYDGGGMEKGSE